MRILLLLASLFAFAPTVEAKDYILPEVVYAQLWGDQVFLVHADRSSTVVAITDVQIVQPIVLNAAGYPGVSLAEPVLTNPSDLTLSYVSMVGLITVRTPCKGMSETRCAEKFKKQVDTVMRLFPKLP